MGAGEGEREEVAVQHFLKRSRGFVHSLPSLLKTRLLAVLSNSQKEVIVRILKLWLCTMNIKTYRYFAGNTRDHSGSVILESLRPEVGQKKEWCHLLGRINRFGFRRLHFLLQAGILKASNLYWTSSLHQSLAFHRYEDKAQPGEKCIGSLEWWTKWVRFHYSFLAGLFQRVWSGSNPQICQKMFCDVNGQNVGKLKAQTTCTFMRAGRVFSHPSLFKFKKYFSDVSNR